MGEKLALEGTSFRTLAPVCVIGVQAEETAESFAAGEKMLARAGFRGDGGLVSRGSYRER
jgi:hypothetical protein